MSLNLANVSRYSKTKFKNIICSTVIYKYIKTTLKLSPSYCWRLSQMENDLQEMVIPSHWSQDQINHHIENMKKAGFKVIVATKSEKIPSHLFNK